VCVACACGVGVRVYEQILQLYPNERHSKKTSVLHRKTHKGGIVPECATGVTMQTGSARPDS